MCGHGVRACLVGVVAAGEYRILRIKVDTRTAEGNLMGLIGHELRHAIEVLDEPAVRSTAAMFLFYNRVAQRADTSILAAFETRAAFEAGEAVRAEARRWRRAVQGR